MILPNGLQVDETTILNVDGNNRIFMVSDLIDYVLDNPGEFRKQTKFNPQKGVWFISAISGLHYAGHRGAGDIGKVLVDGRVYTPYNKNDTIDETDCGFCEERRQTGCDYCCYCGNNLDT